MNKFKWVLIIYISGIQYRSWPNFAFKCKEAPVDCRKMSSSSRRSSWSVLGTSVGILKETYSVKDTFLGPDDPNTGSHWFSWAVDLISADFATIKSAGKIQKSRSGSNFDWRNVSLVKWTRNMSPSIGGREHDATCLGARIGREALDSLDQGTSDSGYRTCTGNLETRGQGLVPGSWE